MRDRAEIENDLNRQIKEILDAARIVTIFDGTDRASIEQLRNALFRFGQLKEEWESLDG